MKNELDIFFSKLMAKNGILEEEYPKYDFLREVCDFFGFSHAFVYEGDHTGNFRQNAYYQIENALPLEKHLNVKEHLGNELLSELSTRTYIIFSGDDPKSEIEQQLGKLFDANTLIFMPILNQHLELAGFVGLSDRRKSLRGHDIDIKNACIALTPLANSVKLELFKKGVYSAEKVLNNVLDHVGIDIYVNDYYTHDILYVNKSMAAPYGGVEAMMGKKCWDAIFTDKTGQCDFCPQPQLLDEDGLPNKTYTWDYERAMDGSWFRVFSSSIPWTDGRIAHIVASVDITENKKNQMLIEKLAQFDHLTGLPNRRSLQDDVELFIKGTRSMGDRWYVLFCDLNGFKKINDTLGHHSGDVLLKSISNELIKLQSDSLKAYRQGGDEFVILLRDPLSPDALEQTLQTLLNIFGNTYTSQGNEMKCGCSIGVAHFPSSATTHKELFHMADMAMYAAKKLGQNSVRFYKDKKYMSTQEYFSAT